MFEQKIIQFTTFFKNIFPPAKEYLFFSKKEHHPFQPTEFDYCENNAWWLSEISMLAYDTPFFVEQAMTSAGFRHVGSLKKQSHSCFIFEQDDFIIIAFRGTQLHGRNGISDYLTDIQVRQHSLSNGIQVHRGFYKAFQEVFPGSGMLEEIITGLSPDKPIWITGHSMGGALALLTANSIKDRPVLVYTFGSPKVGNKCFVDSLTFRHHRIVNQGDPVPTLPPNIHIGKEIEGYYHYGELKTMKIIDLPKTNRIFKNISGFMDSPANKYAFFAHSPIVYCLNAKTDLNEPDTFFR